MLSSCSNQEKFIAMGVISVVVIFFLTRCGPHRPLLWLPLEALEFESPPSQSVLEGVTPPAYAFS